MGYNQEARKGLASTKNGLSFSCVFLNNINTYLNMYFKKHGGKRKYYGKQRQTKFNCFRESFKNFSVFSCKLYDIQNKYSQAQIQKKNYKLRAGTQFHTTS